MYGRFFSSVEACVCLKFLFRQPLTCSIYFCSWNVDAGFKYAVILLEHPDAGGSVLTKESMDIFWELNAETLRVEVCVSSMK